MLSHDSNPAEIGGIAEVGPGIMPAKATGSASPQTSQQFLNSKFSIGAPPKNASSGSSAKVCTISSSSPSTSRIQYIRDIRIVPGHFPSVASTPSQTAATKP